MKTKIHAIQTGSVQIKTAQRARKPGGLVRILTDSKWTEWLPIFAWVIDHPEGVIVVDTGETSKTSEPGYFPGWHPYYIGSIRTNVKPEEEIGPQLESMGIGKKDVRKVILTHFHTDHAGGLHHFPENEILVSGREHKIAKGSLGKLRGYLPHRWPPWFDPTLIGFESENIKPFETRYNVTKNKDVVIVPTPGHTPGHTSVMVKCEDITYFLAGDTSYTQSLLLNRIPDGVSPKASVTLQTMARIIRLAEQQPLVYLPSHDPASLERLEKREILNDL